jgi:hypothetical protein
MIPRWEATASHPRPRRRVTPVSHLSRSTGTNPSRDRRLSRFAIAGASRRCVVRREACARRAGPAAACLTAAAPRRYKWVRFDSWLSPSEPRDRRWLDVRDTVRTLHRGPGVRDRRGALVGNRRRRQHSYLQHHQQPALGVRGVRCVRYVLGKHLPAHHSASLRRVAALMQDDLGTEVSMIDLRIADDTGLPSSRARPPICRSNVSKSLSKAGASGRES